MANPRQNFTTILGTITGDFVDDYLRKRYYTERLIYANADL
jgi:hypothetical protein